jgi:beta-galactosidase GanA
MTTSRVIAGALALTTALIAAPAAAEPPALPRLVTESGRTRLLVAGKPVLLLAGELGNSGAASLAWAKPLLAKLPAMGLNAVLLPVSWELIEPEEGKFDFRLVEGLVREARRLGLRVVPLWFGSWKNSMSSYAPAWVKRDQKRFPRAEATAGRGEEALSAFAETSRDADARAFAALMRAIRKIDPRGQTVILVQVENEVGMLGGVSDRSAPAAAALRGPVPRELIDYLTAHNRQLVPELARVWQLAGNKTQGSWPEVFGRGVPAEEMFMAWHFARYVDAVARAGKAEHALPMFVNAALNRPGHTPGQYPSAGPLPHLIDVWKAGAPTIDVMAPDIYYPDFATWCERYRRADNPLLVPEAKNGDDAAVHALYVAGQQGIGFAPFAIEGMAAPAATALGRAYATIASLAPPLLAAPPGRSAGVLIDKAAPKTDLALGGFKLTVAHDYTFPWAAPARNDPTWPRAGGLVIALADDEFLIAGNGIIVTFAPVGAGEPTAGLERVDEGRWQNGAFVVTRRLNGDETHQGRQVRLPMGEIGVQRVKLYRYR